VVVLLDKLIAPEAVAVDTNWVYFTTNNPPTGPSTAGLVSKDGTASKTVVSSVLGAPAVAAGNGLGYAATWISATQGNISTYNFNSIPSTTSVADSTMGVTVWAATVFFTTTGSKVWKIPPGGAATNFTTWPEIALGPITADNVGVYWVTVNLSMMQADPGGANPVQLCLATAAVNGIATDMSYLYWTDQNGGVYQTNKKQAGTPAKLASPNNTAAYGIAVSPSDSTVYFAQGSEVKRIKFPWNTTTTVASMLVNPRGVAFDGANVFVAERGTGSGTNPDGRILKLPP
jgi:hypothetical protein